MKTETRKPTYTITAAARECGVDRETLSKRLAAAGVAHSEKGYTLGEIVRALSTKAQFDDAKLQEQKHKALLARMDFEERAGRIILKEHLKAALDDVFARMGAVIQRSKLSQKEKTELADIIASMKLGESPKV